jgi:hypothetical protein
MGAIAYLIQEDYQDLINIRLAAFTKKPKP